MTRGGASALIVPSSGTVTWKSDRTSSRNASKASSVRSSSSIRAPAPDPSAPTGPAGSAGGSDSARKQLGFQPLAVGLAGGFRQPIAIICPALVPLVDGRGDIEPLIALQPDQRRPSVVASTLAISVLPTPPRPPAAAPAHSHREGTARSTAPCRRHSRPIAARPWWHRWWRAWAGQSVRARSWHHSSPPADIDQTHTAHPHSCGARLEQEPQRDPARAPPPARAAGAAPAPDRQTGRASATRR